MCKCERKYIGGVELHRIARKLLFDNSLWECGVGTIFALTHKIFLENLAYQPANHI